LYSGEGYLYLAKVIAHLKGIELNDLQGLFKYEIFAPLNMQHSSVVWNDYMQTHRAQGHFEGKTNNGWSVSAPNPNFHPAHSLQSNAYEFALFVNAIINNKLLSKESHKALLSIQSVSPATKSHKERSYGLGVVIQPELEKTLFMHGGNNLSATSHRFSLDSRAGYVFFLNSEHKQRFNDKLMQFFNGS
jgi:CubicO group peptidase (beta-lactamase class C family)